MIEFNLDSERENNPLEIPQFFCGAGDNGIIFHIFENGNLYQFLLYSQVQVEVILEKKNNIPVARMVTTCRYESESNRATMAISKKFSSKIGDYDSKFTIQNETEGIDIVIPFTIKVMENEN